MDGKIIETFGTLSEQTNGWKKKLTLVSWNGKEPKYDIRSWDTETARCGKGITLTKEELYALKDILNKTDF